VSTSVQNQLTKSFAGAESIAEQYPQYATQITAAAKTSFLHGDDWAYAAGLIAVLLGAAVVIAFPRHARETELLARYRRGYRRRLDEPAVRKAAERVRRPDRATILLRLRAAKTASE
jgi:hypothetical protein